MIHIFIFTSPQKLHKPEVNGETFFKYCKKKKKKKKTTIIPEFYTSWKPFSKMKEKKKMKEKERYFQTF